MATRKGSAIRTLKGLVFKKGKKVRQKATKLLCHAVKMKDHFLIRLPSKFEVKDVEQVFHEHPTKKVRNFRTGKEKVVPDTSKKKTAVKRKIRQRTVVHGGGTLAGRKGDWVIKRSDGLIFSCADIDPRDRTRNIFVLKFEEVA